MGGLKPPPPPPSPSTGPANSQDKTKRVQPNFVHTEKYQKLSKHKPGECTCAKSELGMTQVCVHTTLSQTEPEFNLGRTHELTSGGRLDF